MRTVLLIPWWTLWVFTRPPVWSWWVLSRLLSSFRFWLLVFLALLTALVAYYVAADRSTPLSTDAYVQAYVVQIAPEVPGRVVRLYVADNDTACDGEPLFELDPWLFEHKVVLLTAKLAETEQHVRQLGTESSAPRRGPKRRKPRPKAEFATAVHGQEQKIFLRRVHDGTGRYLDALQKLRRVRRRWIKRLKRSVLRRSAGGKGWGGACVDRAGQGAARRGEPQPRLLQGDPAVRRAASDLQFVRRSLCPRRPAGDEDVDRDGRVARGGQLP